MRPGRFWGPSLCPAGCPDCIWGIGQNPPGQAGLLLAVMLQPRQEGGLQEGCHPGGRPVPLQTLQPLPHGHFQRLEKEGKGISHGVSEYEGRVSPATDILCCLLFFQGEGAGAGGVGSGLQTGLSLSFGGERRQRQALLLPAVLSKL